MKDSLGEAFVLRWIMQWKIIGSSRLWKACDDEGRGRGDEGDEEERNG